MKIRGCRLGEELDALLVLCVKKDPDETISCFIRKAIREKINSMMPSINYRKRKGAKK